MAGRLSGRTLRLGAVVAGAAAVAIGAAPALSGSPSVAGRLTLEPVTGPGCASPQGICARGTLKGGLKGTFELTVASVTATADTPTTSVIVYTGDVTIATRDGTLSCMDAGALATTGDRSFASVCTVLGGTGELAGTSGRLRLTGVFPDLEGGGAGEGEYEGLLQR